MTDISVVVPLYNEDESLKELVNWVSRVTESHGFSYEVILIDDGSTDSSWRVIGDLAINNSNIKGARFNRNYGKSAALDTPEGGEAQVTSLGNLGRGHTLSSDAL